MFQIRVRFLPAPTGDTRLVADEKGVRSLGPELEVVPDHVEQITHKSGAIEAAWGVLRHGACVPDGDAGHVFYPPHRVACVYVTEVKS